MRSYVLDWALTPLAPAALPSRRFPSDHLSLCCDLDLTPTLEGGGHALVGGGGMDALLPAAARYPAQVASILLLFTAPL